MVRAFIALGSNLGARSALLDAALVELNSLPLVRVEQVSSFHETEPVGGPAGQGRFLNACARVETEMPPADLLAELHAIERRHGRQRGGGTRNGPRTLDLDLLMYGDLVVSSPGLCVPHPSLEERVFVLAPLAEIAPDLTLLRCRRTVSQRLGDLLGSQPPVGA